MPKEIKHQKIILTGDCESLEINFAHKQYLWFGNSEGRCVGTLSPSDKREVKQIMQLRDWCDKLLKDRAP